MSKDLYAILGVTKDADDDALKRAYKKAAVRWHPDKHATKSDAEKDTASEKFKDIAEAFEVLSDKDKRVVYDRYGYEALKTGACSAPGGMNGGGSMPGGMGFGPGGFPGGVHMSHGGMPSGMRFSFSSSGAGAGMDHARAADIFAAMFNGQDPFADLMGGAGMRGMAMPSMRSGLDPMATKHHSRMPGQAASDHDVLRPGTQVQLHGLSDTTRNNGIGTIETFDIAKHRYNIRMADGGSIAVKAANVIQVVSDAKVIGTSQAQLNGKVAAAVIYDKTAKRYRVEGLTPDGRALALKPENVVLPERTVVMIDGIQSRPTLNGKRGRIVDIDTAAERYTVATSDEQIRLRFGTVVAAC